MWMTRARRGSPCQSTLVAARVGRDVAAEPGGVQERVDDGSVVAGRHPAVRPLARES